MKWLRWEISVKTEEPLRVGGIKRGRIDLPVVLVRGLPTIPGSSLKGALRAEIERYLIENHSKSSGMKPCLPASEKIISAGERALIEAGKYKRGGACEYRETGDKSKDNYICPACYLLGAIGMMGFVRVPYLSTEERPETLFSVRIDRASGTATAAAKGKGASRQYEILPQGTEFNGKMEVLLEDTIRGWKLGGARKFASSLTQGDLWLEKNPGWDQKKILKELLQDRLESIHLLGGFKSKGCGKVSITVTEA